MRGRSRGVVVLLVIIAVVVSAVVLLGSGDRPFDLDSTSGSGYKGLRLTLEDLGATVDEVDAGELSNPSTEQYTAVLVVGGSSATDEQVAQLRRLASPGRTIVTTGPMPALGVEPAVTDDDGPLFDPEPFGREICDVDDLRVVGPLGVQAYIPLIVPDGAESCIGDGRLAAVVSHDVEVGRIVSVASPWLFTNDAMRPHDQEIDVIQSPMPGNVELAGRLLIANHDSGGDRIAVVTGIPGALVGSGETSISDLLSPGVTLGLWQLVVAFAIYAWWRGRRLGQPVEETLPVTIAGSELVSATGNFRERQGDASAAATVLRRDVTRQVADRLGLPRDTTVDVIATEVATRTGRDPSEINGALWGWQVGNDADLVRVTTALDAIRQEITHV